MNCNADFHADSEQPSTTRFVHISGACDRFIDRIMQPAVPPLAKPRLGDVLQLEPAAAALLTRAYRSHYCCDWLGPAGIEKRIESLAGWYARNPLLRSREAFWVLRNAVLDSLLTELCPRCRCEAAYPEDEEMQAICFERGWE